MIHLFRLAATNSDLELRVHRQVNRIAWRENKRSADALSHLSDSLKRIKSNFDDRVLELQSSISVMFEALNRQFEAEIRFAQTRRDVLHDMEQAHEPIPSDESDEIINHNPNVEDTDHI
ncbi:hypothetical protein AC1031_018151 [Aphanomyces cochlioides]|nr:hypothetical protein AC1031_018151 [Aphanomyces cochlioides]